jgi:hypothetical protein
MPACSSKQRWQLAARGRQAEREVVEVRSAGVLLLEERDGLVEQLTATVDGGGAVHGLRGRG